MILQFIYIHILHSFFNLLFGVDYIAIVFFVIYMYLYRSVNTALQYKTDWTDRFKNPIYTAQQQRIILLK